MANWRAARERAADMAAGRLKAFEPPVAPEKPPFVRKLEIEFGVNAEFNFHMKMWSYMLHNVQLHVDGNSTDSDKDVVAVRKLAAEKNLAVSVVNRLCQWMKSIGITHTVNEYGYNFIISVPFANDITVNKYGNVVCILNDVKDAYAVFLDKREKQREFDRSYKKYEQKFVAPDGATWYVRVSGLKLVVRGYKPSTDEFEFEGVTYETDDASLVCQVVKEAMSGNRPLIASPKEKSRYASGYLGDGYFGVGDD